MHSLELFLIVIRKIDMYLTIIVVGQKATNQIAQRMVESWRSFRTLFSSVEAKMVVGNIRKAFGSFSESIQTLSKMTFIQCKDFFDVSRFLYSGALQVCLLDSLSLSLSLLERKPIGVLTVYFFNVLQG